MNAEQLMEIVNTVVTNCINYAEDGVVMGNTIDDEISDYDELSIDEIGSVIEYVYEGLAENDIEVTSSENIFGW